MPLQGLQRSLSFIISPSNSKAKMSTNYYKLNECRSGIPSPLQVVQTDCICCIMPGPRGLKEILMPRPWQVVQVTLAPGFPPCLNKENKHEKRF